MPRNRFQKDKGKKTLSIDVPSIHSLKDSGYMVFSFMHFCITQGSSFREWQENGILHHAVERIKEYSSKKVSQTDTTYTVYGDFPKKTSFEHPKYIPQDARWARIHVDGTHIIVGHVVANTFYVVFLDQDHSFWIVPKKHT